MTKICMCDTQLMCHFFFFNDTATTEIYTLSLHDALPISWTKGLSQNQRIHDRPVDLSDGEKNEAQKRDRKSTRLNSSHMSISYAVFCLKKKNKSALDTERQLAPGLLLAPPLHHVRPVLPA